MQMKPAEILTLSASSSVRLSVLFSSLASAEHLTPSLPRPNLACSPLQKVRLVSYHLAYCL